MNIEIALANTLPEEQHWVPTEALLKKWAIAALKDLKEEAFISICLVSSAEIQSLNLTYRQKDKPTNVLSFPMDIPDYVEDHTLGDVVICPEVLEREAVAFNKSLESYWAHLFVHSLLHLMGFDHVETKEATEMEAKETLILTELGYPAPYGADTE